MFVIPVLDLKSGLAVAARAGDRDRYRPVTGTPEGADPIAWGLRFRAMFADLPGPGPVALYVADLDAIEGRPPRLDLYRSLVDCGLSLMVDAGIRGSADVPPLLDSGVETIVAGLESVTGPSALAEIVSLAGPDRVLFSLDLREGRPLIDPRPGWGVDDPVALALMAHRLGVRRLLLLDLARIGTGGGIGTEGLLSAIQAERPPSLELSVGGGVSGPEDLDRLCGFGVRSVLVGAAIRDGRIGPEHLRRWHGGSIQLDTQA